MIDIHSHILPKVDDGADSITTTLAMAKEALSRGVTTMIATPHHRNGAYMNTRREIEQQTEMVQKTLQQQNISLQLLAGQEVRIYEQMIEDYKAGEILPLNDTQYILIELPFGEVPSYTRRIFNDLHSAGLVPIIAHPERNRAIVRQPNILYELISDGALAQLTATSITAGTSARMKNICEQMISHRFIHLIASDTHNVTSRPNELALAYDEVEKTFGPTVVEKMKHNARCIVSGETITPKRPRPLDPKAFF